MRHLQSFKYIKAIAESGSIRGAAENLTISPSALNRHIQALELDLNIQIFDRLSKGVRLSTEGELFYHFAMRQLASFEQLQSKINDLKGLRTGVVRVGISADLSLRFIHNQISEYQNDHPQVSFQLKVIAQDDLEQELLSNQIDIAMFYQPRIGRSLQVLYAIEAPIYAILPNGAPVKKKNSLLLYDLLGHSILLPESKTELRLKIDAACEKLGLTLFSVMECADPLPHLSATNKSRIGFCLPFEEDYKDYHVRGYKLVPLASKELTTGYINLITATHNLMPLAAQKFIEKLIKKLESTRDKP